MKRILLLTMVIANLVRLSANPSFTISQNPYLTVFAYPHDILYWPSTGFFINYQTQNLPWQGNVSDINARPSASYVNNYQHLEFAPPYEYTGDPEDVYSWSKISGYAYTNDYSVGGLYTTKYGKFLGQLGISTIQMNLFAEGIARAEEDGPVYHLVPFESETNGAQYNYDFKLLYATKLFNNPFGLKINYNRKNSIEPDGYLNFTIDGNEYETDHLTWGWANQACNHIFGFSHINTDAFYQNNYSVKDGSKLDLQISYELNGNHKSALRYRSVSELGDNYNWNSTDTMGYTGSYTMDPDWQSKHTMNFIRGYSKVRYIKSDNLSAGLLYFGQYSRDESYRVNRISEGEPNYQDIINQYIIETNPWFNLKFDKGYLDFGLLLEVEYSAMKNIRNAWNETTGGEESDVIRNSTPYQGWSTSWENFSKGYDMFFATGGEAYASFDIYKRLSMQVGLTILKKYSYIRKEYGNSVVPEDEGPFDFVASHTRNDTRNETWMTGNAGITWGYGPVQFIGIMQFPLSYLNKRQTRLIEEPNDIQFEHDRRNVWQVQKPAAFRLLIVCGLSKPKKH